MAWDKDRPYMPVGENGRPESYADVNPSKSDIDRIYETGGCEVVGRWGSQRFVPFRDVRLKLRPIYLYGGRSALGMIWVDESGNKYCMFAESFEKLNKEHSEYKVPIDGYWSAEKRGQKYGMRLVRMAKED